MCILSLRKHVQGGEYFSTMYFNRKNIMDEGIISFILENTEEVAEENKNVEILSGYLSINTILISLIYYRRLQHKNPEALKIDSELNWTILLILSDCYLNDRPYTCQAWVNIIPCRTLNTYKIIELKKRLLISIDYSLFVNKLDFQEIKIEFEEFVFRKELEIKDKILTRLERR
jgi:hypothetical protein